MRVLLLGADGMLAHDLIAGVPDDVDLVPRTWAETDVASEAAVTSALRESRPDVVINCAAYTNVDQAESERERAFAVNGAGPGTIARVVRQTAGNALIVHYSTDYVFNGRADRPYREEDPTDPIGAYGASKLEGERALSASGATHFILRTQWLFGSKGRSFPRTMWERAISGKATRVVNDQQGRPTYTVDLARATWSLLVDQNVLARATAAGVLHVTNTGTASWYEVALRVFAAAGAEALLTPCTTREYPTAAVRPAYSVLDTTRYERLAGAALPSWENAVDRFVSALRAEGRA